MGIPEGEEREQGIENPSEGIVAESLPNLVYLIFVKRAILSHLRLISITLGIPF